MSRETIKATLWKCDGWRGPCKSSCLSVDDTLPAGWKLSLHGSALVTGDYCPDCAHGAERNEAHEARQDQLNRVAAALASAGLPGVAIITKTDSLLIDVYGVSVSIHREGSASIRWRASGKLPGGTTLDTASGDPSRLTNAILREIGRAKARVIAAKPPLHGGVSSPLASDPRAVNCQGCRKLLYPGQVCDCATAEKFPQSNGGRQ